MLKKAKYCRNLKFRLVHSNAPEILQELIFPRRFKQGTLKLSEFNSEKIQGMKLFQKSFLFNIYMIHSGFKRN